MPAKTLAKWRRRQGKRPVMAESQATQHGQVEALAVAAGLARAWAEHRADVEEAAAAAARLRAGFARPADPADEPSPPYRAPRRERPSP